MKLNDHFKGTFFAIFGAAAYGLNPLFAVPLLKSGLNVPSVLSFRFGLGAILVALLVCCTHGKIRMPLKAYPFVLLNGVMMAISALTLYKSFTLMDVGLASTLLFVYPIMVAVIMTAVFREKLHWTIVVGILMALIGVAALNGFSLTNTTLPLDGATYVMLSSLSYAVFLIVVRVSPLRTVPSDTQTFWTLLIGLMVFLSLLKGGFALQNPGSLRNWLLILGMGFFTTLVSLTFSTLAIKFVGPTITAILGALEPLTAILVGIFVFHEKLTSNLVIGMALIITAVIIVILKPEAKSKETNARTH